MLQDSVTTSALSTYSRGSEEGELCTILRDKIMAYKKAHPRLSSQQIAKRFNMSSSTLGRIENQDIKTPTLEQVVKVLKGTGAMDELMEFMEKFYPEVSNSYKSYYEDMKVVSSSENLADYLTQSSYFKLILCIATGGISPEGVKNNFGLHIMDKIEFLILKEIIFYDQRKNLYLINNSNPSLHTKIHIQHTVECLKHAISTCYRVDKFQSGENYLSFESWEVDKNKVMPKICEILANARQEIRNLVDNPKNNGTDKIYFGLTADVFFSEEETKL